MYVKHIYNLRIHEKCCMFYYSNKKLLHICTWTPHNWLDSWKMFLKKQNLHLLKSKKAHVEPFNKEEGTVIYFFCLRFLIFY